MKLIGVKFELTFIIIINIMDELKVKFPLVEEEIFNLIKIDKNGKVDKLMIKELTILNSEREKRIDAERKIEESKKKNQEVKRQLNEALQELDYLKKKQGIVYKD
tara:strand:- start:314 stop:628 length:315 start_codon:yes stop_codon:yes gene_type:complete